MQLTRKILIEKNPVLWKYAYQDIPDSLWKKTAKDLNITILNFQKSFPDFKSNTETIQTFVMEYLVTEILCPLFKTKEYEITYTSCTAKMETSGIGVIITPAYYIVILHTYDKSWNEKIEYQFKVYADIPMQFSISLSNYVVLNYCVADILNSNFKVFAQDIVHQNYRQDGINQ